MTALRTLLRAAVPVAALALAAGAVGAGCRSLSRDEVERRLLALDKNAPIREQGLERAPLSIAIGDEVRSVELTWVRASGGAGAPRARPVVLVHGTPSTLCTWTEVAFGAHGFDGLSAARDVYALEVAGHGMAEGDLGPYSFQRCADFVVAALRALDLGPVHLVGSSYGGEFAWRAALDAPELVASLALLDSSGYARPEGGFLPEERAMRELALAPYGWLLNSRARIERALAPHFPEIPPDRVEEFYLVCANPANWRAMVELCRDENGTRQDEIARIAAPTLVLWGRDDVAYPVAAYAERFARDIPDARLVVLPTGHYPHEQDPAATVDALETFFSEVER